MEDPIFYVAFAVVFGIAAICLIAIMIIDWRTTRKKGGDIQ